MPAILNLRFDNGSLIPLNLRLCMNVNVILTLKINGPVLGTLNVNIKRSESNMKEECIINVQKVYKY